MAGPATGGIVGGDRIPISERPMSTTTETIEAQQNGTVAVSADMRHAQDGVRALEAVGHDMTQPSVVARGERT